MVEIKDNSMVNKLILLFFMDKMDVPLTDSIILEACYYQNPWLEYMDCVQALNQLLETGFVFSTVHESLKYFSITPDGRACLSHFYSRIPSSVRQEISDFVKLNRALYRRKQEYSTSYHMNPDKTYTVQLKIVDPMKTTLDIKFNVANKETAKSVANKWGDRAAQIYTLLYEQLVD